ncbi:hypothetical protein [Pandoraea fibrosis]|uniref:Uncharacterized protein n=1 Tax=Pandoraea fibrosis TaxID=1891094 RepID=A0A5E4SVY9_9BURK|nr:hypothetical protein [Pandoraea fibrosis]VVD78364.1 hypothetical protein PFI31113_00977 [Pandoraea fibrosis]
MKYAYFDPNLGGKVIQWMDTDAANYVLPDATLLHECSEADWKLREGGDMMVKGGKIAPYVAPQPSPEVVLARVKAGANARITAYAEAKRKEIAGTQDDGEIAGWNNKLRIAQAIVAGNATDADKAAFEGEIAARAIPGETMDIFVQKVLKSAMFYAKAAGIIDGLKRKAQDDVAAAKTPEAVEAVITTMRKKAETAHAELAKALNPPGVV